MCTADLLRAAGGGGREEERVRDRRLRRGGAHGGHAHRGGGHQEEEQQIPPAPGTAPPGLCTLCNAHSRDPSIYIYILHLHTTAQTRLLTSKLEIKFFLRAISKIFAIKVSSEHSLALVYTQMIFVSF